MNKLQQTLFSILKNTKIDVQPEILNVDLLLKKLQDLQIISDREVKDIKEELRKAV